MKLFDKNGNPVEIPDNQVAQALRSGQFGLSENERPTFVKPSGRVVSFDPDPGQIIQALEAGYQIETPEQREKRLLKVEYGGPIGKMGAAALGAARALTFGASDWVAKSLGLQEDVKNLERANPNASMVGEIGGIGAALLVPGGQAKAAGLFSKLGTPIKGVAKLGKAAEKVALKAMGGAQGGLVRQALAKGAALGAGGALEGAIYGAGAWSSDVALGDAELSAESLLGHVQTGALWGGAMGGALGSGSEILRRSIGTGKAFAAKGAKSIRKMWETGTGRKAIVGVDEALENILQHPGVWDEAMGKFTGTDPRALMKLRKDPKALAEATEGLAARDVAAREAAALRDTIRSKGDDVLSVTRGRLKKEFMAEIAAQGDQLGAARTSLNVLDQLEGTLDEMIADPGKYGFKGSSSRAKMMIESTRKEIRNLAAQENAAGRIFNELDQLKRDIGNIRTKMNRIREPSGLEYEAMDRFSDMYMKMKEPLEDADLWGKKAAEAQKRVNTKWTAYLRRAKFKPKYRFDRMEGMVDWGVTSADEGGKMFKADAGLFRQFIDDLGTSKADLDLEHFRNQAQLKNELMDEIAKHYDLGEKAQSLTAAKSANRKLQGLIDEMERKVGLQNQLGDIVSRSNAMAGILPTVGGLGGYVVGGPLGAGAGLALSVMTNPGRLLHLKAAFHRMKEGFQLGIAKSLSSYIKKAKAATEGLRELPRKSFVPASLKILQNSQWGDKKLKAKDRYEAFNQRFQELSDFLSEPNRAVERIGRNLDGLHEVFPKIAEQMAIKGMVAARYLHDQAPRPLTERAAMSGKWKPSDAELTSWAKKVAAVNDPTELLRELEAGRLSIDTVEAVKTVYPKLYEQIVLQIAEEIPELREKLPYNDRVQLSILFNLPVEETMRNDFVMAMQQVAAADKMAAQQMQAPQQRPKKRAKSGAFRKMEFGGNMATATQQVAARGAEA